MDVLIPCCLFAPLGQSKESQQEDKDLCSKSDTENEIKSELKEVLGTYTGTWTFASLLLPLMAGWSFRSDLLDKIVDH